MAARLPMKRRTSGIHGRKNTTTGRNLKLRKTWKAGMVSILSASLFTFGTSAFAAGTTNEQPTMSNTPDHFFYFLNRWREDINLWVSLDPAKKAELLTQYAQERMNEAKQMIKENKTGYTSDLMKSYMSDINDAQKNADQALVDQNTDQKTKEDIMNQLDQATEVDASVQKQMDSQETSQLSTQKQDIILKANVVQNLDPKTVKSLRDQGLGYGEVVKVMALAKATGKDPSEIVSKLKDEHKGFGEIYKALGVNPKELAQKIIDSKIAALQTSLDQAKSSGDQKSVDKITKTLNHLTAKKAKFDALTKLSDLRTSVKQQADQIKQKVASGQLSKADAKKQLSDLKQQAKQQFDHLRQTMLDQIKQGTQAQSQTQDQAKVQDQTKTQDQTQVKAETKTQDQTKVDDQKDTQKTDGVENETKQTDKQKSENDQNANDHASKGLKTASEHKQNPNANADKGQKIASEHKQKAENDTKQEDQNKSEDQKQSSTVLNKSKDQKTTQSDQKDNQNQQVKQDQQDQQNQQDQQQNKQDNHASNSNQHEGDHTAHQHGHND